MALKLLAYISIMFYTFLSVPIVQAEKLNIATAANFSHTLGALKTVFENKTPHKINIISASTGQLTQQISQHAPFDVFLAANTEHPKRLWQQLHTQRALTPHALMIYAKGRLVFYSRLPLTPNTPLPSLLSDKHYLRLSMANPKLAPYGMAAKQTLKCLKLDKQWQSKFVLGQNVAQAFQFIDSQNVEGGFVAMSQVLNKKPTHIYVIDEACYADINQMALRLNNKPASLEFMNFLKSDIARNMIQRHGYRLP